MNARMWLSDYGVAVLELESLRVRLSRLGEGASEALQLVDRALRMLTGEGEDPSLSPVKPHSHIAG